MPLRAESVDPGIAAPACSFTMTTRAGECSLIGLKTAPHSSRLSMIMCSKPCYEGFSSSKIRENKKQHRNMPYLDLQSDRVHFQFENQRAPGSTGEQRFEDATSCRWMVSINGKGSWNRLVLIAAQALMIIWLKLSTSCESTFGPLSTISVVSGDPMMMVSRSILSSLEMRDFHKEAIRWEG